MLGDINVMYFAAGASNHEVSPEQTGDASNAESPTASSEVIEVTIPLQCLVRDSRLELLEASKVCQPKILLLVCE